MSSSLQGLRLVGIAAAVCFTAVTVATGADPGAEAVARLKERFPGVRTLRTDEGERAVYGRRMSGGATVAKAAATWIQENFDALGDRTSDLRATRAHTIGGGRLAVVAFQQYIDGLPVEDAMARVVVLRGRANEVVYAGGRLARRPEGGFPPIATTAEQVVAGVRGDPNYAGLTEFSAPRLAVFVPEGDFSIQPAIRVWKFSGWGVGPIDPAFTFFVDASIGRVVHVRDEIHHVDILGQVAGNATPGVRPDVATNPAVRFDLPEIFVEGPGGTATTDDDGDFQLVNPGSAAVEVEAALAGPWVTVIDNQGENLSVSSTVTPPGPIELFLNAVPSPFTTAQVNGFIHANVAHDFFKSRQPDFTGLDLPIDCNVNIASICNAAFNPFQLSISFFASGGGCVNTAYSSVIHHEYGHFIVNQHDLTQGAFGEGYADCMALMINNDPVVGRDFQGTDQPVRDIVAANQQYPCFGEIHECGQLLAGVWWDIKLNLDAKLGAAGFEYTRQLFTDWTVITVGGRLRNSAHPLTAVEVLTVDDDDADFGDGTPNRDEICDAFAKHGIACPGSCAGISSLKLRCGLGGGTIRATITSDAPAGTEFTLRLDESPSETVSVSRRGRGSAKFSGVSGGPHTVCVEGCAEVCESVTCNP